MRLTKLEMPMHQMHAGEELLWIVIPAFLIMMIVDIVKRRNVRRQSPKDAGGDGSGASDSGPKGSESKREVP